MPAEVPSARAISQNASVVPLAALPPGPSPAPLSSGLKRDRSRATKTGQITSHPQGTNYRLASQSPCPHASGVFVVSNKGAAAMRTASDQGQVAGRPLSYAACYRVSPIAIRRGLLPGPSRAGRRVSDFTFGKMTGSSLMAEVTIEARPNGPYIVNGPVELRDTNGNILPTQTRTVLCRCGASTKKPFCDGTHSKIGFQAAAQAVPESTEKS